jgi:hypothetical protein
MSTDNNYARLLRGEILTQWTLLDAEAVEHSNGDRAEIISQLRKRYGFSQKRAAREIDRVCQEFSEKLRRTA